MANELAVKVKVNLDTSAKALDSQLSEITKHTSKNPVKIAVQVDKKSLTDSLNEAFGKKAAQSIKKNLQDATNIKDVGKDTFSNMIKGIDESIEKTQNLIKLKKQLYTLLEREKYVAPKIESLKGDENSLNELAAWQKIYDDIREKKSEVYDAINENDIDGTALVNDKKYLSLTQQIADAKDVEISKLKDAAALRASKDIEKSAKDELTIEKTAIDDIVTALQKYTQAEVDLYNAQKKGNSGNADEAQSRIDKADAELKAAKASADAMGVAWENDKKYQDALAASTSKTTRAYNELNEAKTKASNATAAENAAKAEKEEQDAVNAVIKALQEKTQKQIEYNKYAQKNDTRNMEEKYYEQTKAAQKLADAEAKATALNPAWRQKQEYIDALDDSIAKTAVSLNDYANAQDKALSGQQAQEQAAQEKELTAAVREYLAAAREASKYNVDMINSSASGRQDNVESYANQMVAATEKMGAAADKMRSLGVEPTQIKEVFDVITTEAGKSEIAVNNLNKTMQDLQTKDIQDAFNGLTDAMDRAANAEAAMYKARQSGDTANETEQLRQLGLALKDIGQYSDYLNKHGVDFTQFTEFENTSQSGAAKVNSAYNSMEKAIDRAANANESLNASIDNTIEKANALNATTQKNGAGKVDMTAFNQAFNEFNNIANDTSGKYSDLKVKSDALQKSFQKMGIAAGNINTALKDDSAVTRAKTNFANLNAQITRFLNNNPRVSSNSDIYAQFQALATATKECSGDIDKLRMKEAQLEAQSERLGLTTETLAGKFSRLFKEHFQTAAVMAGIHLTQQGFQQVYQNVVEVDDSMTELKKVTDEMDTAYSQFTQRAAKQSRELGADISDYVQTTADWARLGYNLPDSEDLARVSSLFANVGDGIESATQASEYLISTLKGFNLVADDAERVVDVINQVANTEPVSAQDISEILQRSAAALSASNTSFEKTVALGTAMNSVLQNSATTGTALKTLSMYLRATKTELEENGEDAEYCASSMSELRDSILALTKGKVDIQLDDDSYKDVYDIMQEISQVYDDLTDKEQASLLNLLGGKRNANAVQALIQQFQIAEDTLNQTQQAAGSAMKENDTYMSSIQGKLDQLSSSFQNLSINLLDSDIVKFFADLAINVTDFTNSLVKANALVPTLISAVSAYGTLSKKDFGKVNMPAYIHCQENIGCRSINTPLVCWETLKPYSPIAC